MEQKEWKSVSPNKLSKKEGVRELILLFAQDDYCLISVATAKRALINAMNEIKEEIEKEYLAEGHLTDYWGGIDKCLDIINKHIIDMS